MPPSFQWSGDAVISEKDGYRVVKCSYCGTIRTEERNEDYETLYTEGTRYHIEEMDKIGRDHYLDRFDHDFDLAWNSRVPILFEHLRSLDVGCANGAFVVAMRASGIVAEGLELNPTMAAYARDTSHCPIHETWDTVQGEFDIVTYHDVFEHVVDPRDELYRVRAHLRSQGLLVLDCPDADEVFGENARTPHHEKPDQHLFYYTEHTLRSLLASSQFIVVNVERPIVGKLVVYARKNGE
jgi:2-polyprenyl-3-methyl-5-hydroxy-6-metoxy-1,4-benzoquinol methylase